MGESGCPATSGQREAAPFWKVFGGTVDALLEIGNVVESDDARRLVGRAGFCGKLCANDKEIVLDGDKTIPVDWLCDVGKQEADLSIQLVDGAVALKARTSLDRKSVV